MKKIAKKATVAQQRQVDLREKVFTLYMDVNALKIQQGFHETRIKVLEEENKYLKDLTEPLLATAPSQKRGWMKSFLESKAAFAAMRQQISCRGRLSW